MPADSAPASRSSFGAGRWLRLSLLLLVVWGLELTGSLRFVDAELEDLRFQLLRRPAGADLTVVAIDGRSLQELAVWPWPRSIHAAVTRRLVEAGARSIAFDVDFSALASPKDDHDLEASFRDSPVPVILPVFKQLQRRGQDSVVLQTEPQPRFAAHADLASINVYPSEDGLVRQMQTREPWGDGSVVTLAARLADRQHADPGRFFIDFGIDLSSLPVISYVDVYQGGFDPALVSGRDVLIGSTAIELGDLLPVPVHISMPGVLLHALAAEALVQGRALSRLGFWPMALFTLLIAIAIGRFGAAWPWRLGLVVTVIGTVVILALTTSVQWFWPVLIGAAAPILLLVALFIAGLVGRLSQQDLRLLAQSLAIRRKDAFMRQVVEHSFDGIVTVDSQGAITSCNPSATRMFAWPADQVVGQPVAGILSEAVAVPIAKSRLTTPGGPYEMTGWRHDGSEFPVNVVVSEMRADDDPIFIAFVRDISARKRAEARAAEARNRLLEAIECISEGFVLYDRDDRMILSNSKFREMLGQDDEFAIPGWRFEDTLRAIVAQGLIKVEDGETDAWVSSRVDRHRNPRGPFEVALDGGLHVMVSERRTHEGGIVGIYTDITDLKLREHSLEMATREAEAASRSKSEFLANMSHELRTPLNAIIGFSEIISDESLGPTGVPQYKDYASDIVDSGKHLLGIVNDILDVSKIEAGEYSLNEEEIDLCETVRACCRLVHLRAETAGHELIVEIPDEPYVVFADERSTKQVLINLLGNAIKFTPEGGRITVELTSLPTGEVAVAVADTGIGIAEEDIPKALAFFGQVDSKLARVYEGTGLGLPLARNLIEMQGGRLDLESALGQGTRVTIAFPAERVVSAPAYEGTEILAS